MRGPAWGSVRVRTTLAATAVVALSLAVGTWVLLLTLEGALTRQPGRAARTRARDVASLVSAGNLSPVLAPTNDDSFIQVVGPDGQVRSATSNVSGRPAAFSFRPAGARAGGAYRQRRPRRPGPRGLPRLGGPRGVRRQRRERLRRHQPRVGARTPSPPCAACWWSACRSMTALLGLPDWTVVGRALRPVESIRAEVADISDSNLSRRVPEPPGGDEIAQLARTMNAMLDRLEAASRRQRAFAADASHELQSPLTRLRTHLEVAMSHPATTDWEALAGDLWSDGAEMERLVRDLLFLARDDERPGEESASRSGRSRRRGARGGCADQGRQPGAGRDGGSVGGAGPWQPGAARPAGAQPARERRAACPDPSRGQRVRRPRRGRAAGHRRRAGRAGRAPDAGLREVRPAGRCPVPRGRRWQRPRALDRRHDRPGTVAPARSPTAVGAHGSCSGSPPSSTEASLHPVGRHLGCTVGISRSG